MPLVGKISASTLIHYFSIHQAAFGYQAFSPLDNIPLNTANNKIDQCLSDIQTGIGTVGHTTLDTAQLISETIASLQGSEREVIPASEVHQLVTNISGILGNALSKWFGNEACILAYLLIMLLGSFVGYGALQLPFLHNFRDTFSPSEACLYGHINWSVALAQAGQQSSLGLSQSSTSMRGSKARSKAGFQLNVQKSPLLISGGGPLAKKPHL